MLAQISGVVGQNENLGKGETRSHLPPCVVIKSIGVDAENIVSSGEPGDVPREKTRRAQAKRAPSKPRRTPTATGSQRTAQDAGQGVTGAAG